jgi:hypothetical protein
VKELILLILGTDPIMVVQGRMVVRGRMVVQGRTTAQGMQLTRAPLRSKLAIGRITIAALVITWAAPITSGGRDIGHRVTVEESGSTATTL